MSSKLLAWISAWLIGRTQQVLGPPLLIIYIDDLEDAVLELDLLLKFADDTKGLQEIK